MFYSSRCWIRKHFCNHLFLFMCNKLCSRKEFCWRYTCEYFKTSILSIGQMCYNINFTKKISSNKASVVVADFEDNIWHAVEQKNANDARMLILQEVWDSNENYPGQNDMWLCDLCRKLLVYIIIYWNINCTNTLIIILSIK